MKNKLPIVQPPKTGYLTDACYLSVLLQHKKLYDWFYLNFIDLYFFKEMGNKFKIDFYSGKYKDYITNLSFVDFRLIDKREDWFQNHPIDFIRKSIEEDYYVMTKINEYFLPGKWAYMKENYIHNILIYGYDDEKEKFSVGTWGNNDRFSLTYEVGYDDFRDSIRTSIAEPGVRDTNYKFLKFKCNDLVQHYEFNIEYVKRAIEDYLDSLNLSYKYGFYSSVYTDKYYGFGIDVYSYIKKYIDKCIYDKKEINHIPFYSLFCHKQYMLKRLIYLRKEKNFTQISEEIIDEYKVLTDSIQTCCFLIYKKKVKDILWNENDLNYIHSIIENANVLERRILSKVIAVI